MISTLKERSDSIYGYVEDALDKSAFLAIEGARTSTATTTVRPVPPTGR